MHSRLSFGSEDDARSAPFPDSRALLKYRTGIKAPATAGAQGAMLAFVGPRT